MMENEYEEKEQRKVKIDYIKGMYSYVRIITEARKVILILSQGILSRWI